MFDVIFPRHGAILNANHGVETEDGLTIDVRCAGGETGTVTVNGVEATFDGTGCSAKITLTQKFNTIKVVLDDNRGLMTRELSVVWDKKSFKRYNYFLDDHSFFFTEIAAQRPKSIFDHFYLKFLKEMNKKYGTKFTLNIFFQNCHDKNGFTLDKFPDAYKSEWEDNADWLRLAFHARAEFPDRIYQNAQAEEIENDFDKIETEIKRIAGEKTLIAPVALHWAMCRPETLKVFVKHGVKCLEGQFLNPRTGISDAGSREFVCDVGYFVNLDDSRYLEAQGVIYDFKHKIAFYRGDCTANLWTPEQIRQLIDVADKKNKYWISLASHEQYSFPSYFNYLPDHHARIETAIREVTERGYKPVFFANGFFGNEN